MASGALRWGAPSLDTAICEITPAGPSYRGRSARGLVRDGASFEAVAELLWTAELPTSRPRWFADTPAIDFDQDELEELAAGARPLDRMRVALMLTEMGDVTRFGPSREARLDCARRIIAVLSYVVAPRGLCQRGGPPPRTVASLLSTTLGGKAAETTSLFDAALIAMADHELNASTFAARVAASTGASLYACVAAGLAAASGPRHGTACDRCEALIDETVQRGLAPTALLERVQRGESIPGFGHRLYPHGDPRWKMIVSRLGPAAAGELRRSENSVLASKPVPCETVPDAQPAGPEAWIFEPPA